MDSNHRSLARKSRFCRGRRIAGPNGVAKRVVSYAVPMVRIHLPPAGSHQRTFSRLIIARSRRLRARWKFELVWGFSCQVCFRFIASERADAVAMQLAIGDWPAFPSQAISAKRGVDPRSRTLDAIISAATCSGSRRNAPGRSAYRRARDSTGLADSKDPASRQISCGP